MVRRRGRVDVLAAGQFVKLAKKRFKRVVEIVNRSNDVKGLKVLPKRWIVQRTFGGSSKYCRLSMGYEVWPENSVAMIILMLHRIQRG